MIAKSSGPITTSPNSSNPNCGSSSALIVILLVSINKQKAYNLDIQKITDLFQSEEGKYITIEVNRNGKLLKFKFQLEKVL